MELRHPGRVLLLAAVFLGFAIAAFLLWKYGSSWFPGCMFRKWTGLECPGCGMTRATEAMLHGRLLQAFSFNPVGMVLFPLAVIACGFKAIGWARGTAAPIEFKTGRWGATVIAVVVIAWWILRNLL